MAGGDYRSCDVCGNKAFYDTDCDYDSRKIDSDGNPKLGRVGSMKVLCDKCSETHVVIIMKKIQI